MAMELMNLPHNQLRAGQSLQEAYVLFLNSTKREINLYWVSYNGNQTFYLTLRPSASVKVNTFRSHPWVFRDYHTGERMQVAHQNTFWPQPVHMPDPKNRSRMIPCRRPARIHFPVRKLYEIGLWSVVKRNMNTPITEEEIDKLCVPKTVTGDLKAVLNILTTHRTASAGPLNATRR